MQAKTKIKHTLNIFKAMTQSVEIISRINEAKRQGMGLNRICKELQLGIGMVRRWMCSGWKNNV